MSGTVAAGTASAYDFNVTITYNGAVFVPPVRTVYAYEYNNYVLLCNVTGSSGGGTANAFGRNDTWTFYTVSLKPGSVGQVTSNCSVYRQTPPLDQTLPVPNQLTSDDLVNYAGAYDTVGHVLPLWGIRSLVWYGINTDTGAIWGPTAPQVAMDYYAAPDNTQFNRDSFAMNGYLFEVSWGGILYMYNATTGTLLYQYGLAGLTLNANVTTAGQYTLYNGYPSAILGATTENNMVYTFVNEHSPNVPELKNSYMRCFDIANMNEVWIESQYGGVWTTGQGQEILGNGYNTELNSHNMEIMCEGVGPSATTVMATNSTVVGNKMMIEGTVMDVSPGTVQNDLAGRFPNGVPAVQDGNNMTAWMEYLYMHHEPRPDVLGVPVTLTVVDASGTTTDIGTATTDSTGYFSFLYTPSTAGTYTIIAAFQGSTAYAPSYSQSTYTVAPPSATASPTPTPSPAGVSTDTYVLGSTAAIIVVIAIVTAVIALMLRKKP
jgi:hypothetical protein